MTQEELLEYNKKCAEFLGLKRGWWISQQKPLTDDKKQWCDLDGKTFLDSKVYFDKDLKFHSDWNWIMEVVEAINKTQNPMQGGDTTHSTLKREVQALLGKAAKEAVVQAINQFLIWYEQNKAK